MKKILTLVAGFLAATTYAQCTISGESTIKLNENASYSVDSKAQCDECFLWKSSEEKNLQIDGNNKTNKIIVKASNLGKSTISVSVLGNQGLVQCEKIIEVTSTKPITANNDCGVHINDFKEVKVTETSISFFPNENSSDYLYNWTVTYANGETKESTEKIPQFFYSEINYITLVKLKITNKSPICSLSISKKYEQNYWKPVTTQVGKVEQKTYSPVSYSDYVKPADGTTKVNQK